MTTVQVTDTFKVEIDNFGNHNPVYFREGGEVIKNGKFKGQISKSRWIASDKYFNNLARAIHYGVTTGLVDGDSVQVKGCTLDEYLVHLEEIYDKTYKLISTMDSELSKVMNKSS